jgi:hypothetical protein
LLLSANPFRLPSLISSISSHPDGPTSQSVSLHHQRLELKAGDALVFRGDLVHGGAAYEHDNVRVHGYLEPADFKRKKIKKDGTEVTYYMDECPHILRRGAPLGHPALLLE